MQKHTYTSAIALALVSLTSYSTPAIAQSNVAINYLNLQVDFQQPRLPDNGAPTGRRKGAAGRGNNCAFAPPLTALVPQSESAQDGGKITYVWGKTIAERPTFWFYVPDFQTSLISAEFVLQDGEDDVYRTPVILPKVPGIASIRLPSTVMPLKVGKMYQWFLKVNINCASPELSSVKDYVEGWVVRVTPNRNLVNQLKTATPQQQIALYAANGIWYEALTSLAELRSVDTSNALLQNNWTDLLHSVGLSDVASEPIVQCCTFDKAYSYEERTIQRIRHD